MTHPDQLVTMKSLCKTYPAFRLGPIDWDIEPGLVYALVGPNGSGKSTLFRMMMQLVQPEEGTLHLFGRRYPEEEVAIKERIGYVPEESLDHGKVNVTHLVSFISQWYPRWNQETYKRLIRELEIPVQSKYHQLSKGEKKRLSLAMALSAEPQLLLLDEPTDGLDFFGQRAFSQEMDRFLQPDENRSVVLATHRAEDIRKLADVLVLIHKGRYIGSYEKDQLTEEWKELWLDALPAQAASLPGVVRVEAGPPVRLITRSFTKTRSILSQQGYIVTQTLAMELSEILQELFLLEQESPASNHTDPIHNQS
ncbi:ABC transporter ATP-binding protein [Desmospora profundinema]|uniref:ABC-2 type transport system ATP-binding protein n=1 Tax=Desmospora profundinema TaxID=1571184 RepID=A0ABU1IKR1_9BACL|nr:ABC transporter ATP-binding protein [Desmospora profundinema]MDR6225356.1 ABC-2 type transport system ATP-binding protein [Desmospora profundinema]